MEICGTVLICAACFCFLIGAVMFLTRGARAASRRANLPEGMYAPGEGPSAKEVAPLGMTATDNIVKSRARRMVEATLAQPTHPLPAAMRTTGNPTRDAFARAQLGQTIIVNHPQRGPLTGQILGTIRYTELWQKVKSASEPWVPTGNQFTAHWLGNFMIYEWQERLYLLDEYEAISDQDIQSNFLPYARKYAESDQTAKITFAWPPASWTIADIGKFTVAEAQGNGLRLNPGATGRFIHATGADNRALVLEDYQSGSGGLDTAWTGWQIGWDALQKI